MLPVIPEYVKLICISLIFSSCLNTQRISYFNEAKEAVYAADFEQPDNYIQKNDILDISISSLNPDASALFNQTNGNTNGKSVSGPATMQYGGYLVNENGFIQLPMLGNIKAVSKSKTELRDLISTMIVERKLLIDPIVTIRHLNFEVTVIGEVAKPSVIAVPSEKISLVKALGLAGDITIYGKKDNVLLIREANGKKTIKRINLNAADFLNSPYYYLQPNDIVYVEPNKNKLASVGRGRQLLPVFMSGLSVMVIVLDRVL
jgi:polysaccharide export outer membrane protein